MNPTVTLSGLKEAIANLKGMGDRAVNVLPVSRDILLIAQADVDRRFDQAPPTEVGGQTYGGAYWPPLTTAYLNRNPRRFGGQLLRDTGELQQSYGIGGTGNIAVARPDQIVFGSNLPRAGYLANRKGKERPQVYLHAKLLFTVRAALELYLGGAFK